MSNLFHLWSGKETVRGKSAQLMIFACPTIGSDLSKEVFITQAMKQDSSGITRAGLYRMHEAAPGKIAEFGRWFEQVVDIRDGVILKIVGQRMVSAYGRRRDGQRQDGRAVVYLEARKGAALRKISFQTTHEYIMQFTQVTIQGRFDILTPALLEQTTLSALSPYQRADLSEIRVARVFTITTEEPEQVPCPVVVVREIESADGGIVRVKSRKRQRRIEL